MSPKSWTLPFISDDCRQHRQQWVLIVLNQPFSLNLFKHLWEATYWHCFADGASNRVFDTLSAEDREAYLPDLIKGDLDSIRPEVRKWYEGRKVDVIGDPDLYATDLMKCVSSIKALEEASKASDQLGIIILGGLSGRFDHTVHILSYLHKLRAQRERVFVVTDDNICWVLDSGEHDITVDRSLLGPTCGLLPLGVGSTTLSTRGLEWNLTEQESSFDGLVSTSNWLAEDRIWVKTSQPIWWCVERKNTEKDLTPSRA
ncbi:hypothetical protein FRC04_005674 [Tulasnella sp. 424]|nr:hypothetical protein FRC04_005674 [Tulasnella sp. 424]KAG8961805.1 hypothetical protein FRC05_005787 [Tulasnella sp. 425]